MAAKRKAPPPPTPAPPGLRLKEVRLQFADAYGEDRFRWPDYECVVKDGLLWVRNTKTEEVKVYNVPWQGIT